jgi:DNA-binding MarR family transcriptional regulator
MNGMESVMMTNMNRFRRLNDRKMEAVMTRYNIRKIDIEIILYLTGCEGRDTARDIAATEMFTKGHISQSVKRLQENGYIEIVQDEKDLRVQHLKLTDKVADISGELKKIREEIHAIIFKGISAEDMETMRKIFTIMYDNIAREIGES